MCVIKTPKISPEASKEKPVQVFTNRYFVDRGADAVAARSGRNALRIDLGSPAGRRSATAAPINNLTPGVQMGIGSGAQAPTIPNLGDLRSGIISNNLAIL
jgi:hypothetical protein